MCGMYVRHGNGLLSWCGLLFLQECTAAVNVLMVAYKLHAMHKSE